MADIFDEINAEMRQDRTRALWDKYGVYVIGLVLAIILAVGGSSAYSSYVANESEAASARYELLLQDIDGAPTQMRLQALRDFSEAENSTYGVLAAFMTAQTLQAEQQLEAAIGIYDDIADDSRLANALRDYATISASYALVGTVQTANLEVKLRHLLLDSNGFRHAAREIIALSFFLGKDYLAAREQIELALQDEGLPRKHAERLAILSEAVRANMTDNKL